jgi:hypothetical protein
MSTGNQTPKSRNFFISNQLFDIPQSTLPHSPDSLVNCLENHLEENPADYSPDSVEDNPENNLDDSPADNPEDDLPQSLVESLDNSPENHLADYSADSPENHLEENSEDNLLDNLPDYSADCPVNSLPDYLENYRLNPESETSSRNHQSDRIGTWMSLPRQERRGNREAKLLWTAAARAAAFRNTGQEKAGAALQSRGGPKAASAIC